MGETERKLFVQDTNIHLHEPFALDSFQELDIVTPTTVPENPNRSKNGEHDGARNAEIGQHESGKAFSDKAGDNRILSRVWFLQKKKTLRSVIRGTKNINTTMHTRGAGVLYIEDTRTDQITDNFQYFTPKNQQRPRHFSTRVTAVDSNEIIPRTMTHGSMMHRKAWDISSKNIKREKYHRPVQTLETTHELVV